MPKLMSKHGGMQMITNHYNFIPFIPPGPRREWAAQFNFVAHFFGMYPTANLTVKIFFDPKFHSSIFANTI